MMMAKVLVLLVLCVGLTLINACSCPYLTTPDRFCSYNIIFRGTALSEYKQNAVDGNSTFGSTWVYTMRIDMTIQMPEQLEGNKTLISRSLTESNLCGVRFYLNVDSLFVGDVNSAGEMITNLCAFNAAWNNLTSQEREVLSNNYEEYCANSTKAIMHSDDNSMTHRSTVPDYYGNA